MNKVPLGKYSVTITRFGGLLQTAINNTILGCLNTVNILISLLTSLSNSGVITGSKICLIAT